MSVTLKEQAVILPAKSVAVYSTEVVPAGNTPGSRSASMVGSPQLSVAVTDPVLTGGTRAAQVTVTGAGQVMVGGVTSVLENDQIVHPEAVPPGPTGLICQ